VLEIAVEDMEAAEDDAAGSRATYSAATTARRAYAVFSGTVLP
jgi:hypothetical protein